MYYISVVGVKSLFFSLGWYRLQEFLWAYLECPFFSKCFNYKLKQTKSWFVSESKTDKIGFLVTECKKKFCFEHEINNIRIHDVYLNFLTVSTPIPATIRFHNKSD